MQGNYINLSLSEPTINQFAKLLGVVQDPSPKGVAELTIFSSRTESDEQFRKKLNELTSYFLNETVRNTLTYTQHCGSMQIWTTDVNNALEQFAKNCVRRSQLSEYTSETLCDEDDDEEWLPLDGSEEGIPSSVSEESRRINVETAPIPAVMNRDHSSATSTEGGEDEDMNIQSEDDTSESTEDEGPWITRPEPTETQTTLYDEIYPKLNESEEYFKMSDDEFIKLVSRIMEESYSLDLPFVNNSHKTLRNALFRYIMVEYRKEGEN